MSLRWTESESQFVHDSFLLIAVSLKDSRIVGTRTDCPVPFEHYSLVIGGRPGDLDQQLA